MIGVTNTFSWYNGGIARLKRDLLFVDKIVIANVLFAQMEFPTGTEDQKLWAKELDFLLDTEYFDSEIDEFSKFENALNYKRSPIFLNTEERINSILQEIRFDNREEFTASQFNQTLQKSRMLYKLQARQSAILLSELGEHEAVSLDGLKEITPSNTKVSKNEVFDLAIRKVPLPDDKTPWQNIFDMAADDELKNKAKQLRLWARKLVRESYTIAEVKEELEELIYSYEKAMKLHKVKLIDGVLTSVILSTSVFAENLLKLRFSKIAEHVVSVRDRSVDLMIEEMNFHGREISLISSLKSKFE